MDKPPGGGGGNGGAEDITVKPEIGRVCRGGGGGGGGQTREGTLAGGRGGGRGEVKRDSLTGGGGGGGGDGNDFFTREGDAPRTEGGSGGVWGSEENWPSSFVEVSGCWEREDCVEFEAS